MAQARGPVPSHQGHPHCQVAVARPQGRSPPVAPSKRLHQLLRAALAPHEAWPHALRGPAAVEETGHVAPRGEEPAPFRDLFGQ
eukprot:7898300-Lingulodinium_polyedra.AAC.1